MLRTFNCLIIGIFFMSSGCVGFCEPNACVTSEAVIEQLNPITSKLSENFSSHQRPPNNLEAILGDDLSLGSREYERLYPQSGTLGTGYVLLTPDPDVYVAYSIEPNLMNRPSFYFFYLGRWGRDTCVWIEMKNNWNCSRH